MHQDDKQQKWREISARLDEALDLEEPARAQWLEELARHSPETAAAVRALLEEGARLADSSLLAGDPTAALVSAGLAGQVLGAWTLVSPLGHGGSGSVWLAHRSDGRFEGQAAVKLLNIALLGRPAAQRFVREGSLLARLRHPNIGQLIDAGVAPGGQPYLVLEYVPGERIDTFAERRGLDIDGRVRLFLEVLAAVAHAHSHLVVHRDLKPSNILVTADGAVKLLDFGVAALLDGRDVPASSELTREGPAGLTPEYAAPEQLLGQPVTTATDVYALGLVLFVMLAGRHPLDSGDRSAAAMSRATLDHEPPRPSQIASDAQAGRVLRGDLDNIVAKALKKNPADRYQSAELLAQDLRRYLGNEPVSARADSLAYRAGKFVRRHRGGVAAGVAFGLVLIGAAITITLQMFEAQRQRDAAVFQRKRAEYQARFAYQIMSEVGGDDKPITIRALLEKGVEVLEKNYSDDPAFVISSLINISGRYMDLSDTDGEYAALLKAEALARKLGDPAQIASVQCNTVETEIAAGRTDKAAERLKDALAHLTQLPDASLGLRIECGAAQARLSWARNELDAGVVQAREVARLMEANDLQTDVKYNSVVSMLENMLSDSGHLREALDWNRRGTEILAKAGRENTYSMSGNRHNQASYLLSMGDVRSAYEIEKAVVAEFVAQQGIEGVPIQSALLLGVLQVRVEETDAGLEWIERAGAQAAKQGFRPGQIGAVVYRARCLVQLGRTEGVAAQLDEAERMAAQDPQAFARMLQAIHQTRARLLLARHDAAAALAEIDVLLAAMDYPRRRDDDRLAATLTLRAQAQAESGRQADALASARDALAVAESQAPESGGSANVGGALMVIADIQRAQGDEAGALASATRAARALELSLGPGHSETRRAKGFSAVARR
ncbi:MAG TPA: protein kinase [Steroidobacteraceae bacterium]|nr:protein kinase [Steroidobacteraceae bacterium]